MAGSNSNGFSSIDSPRNVEEEEVVFDVEQEEEERDLLLQQSDREENVLRFLQALDLQVIGACRADERLIPLLKANVSNSVAEDRFFAQLIQHFEAQEIGMLARCLCMPLVSIRVGRVIKQGKFLRPTSLRGSLILTLLPSSNLRISFVGDDGCSDRLATLSGNCRNSAIAIEEIPADTTGRSFVLKLPSGEVYFWCSEKSKLLGNELLAKMKDVLERKPSLAELTGISETRLDCFALHFREYLLGSTVTKTQTSQMGAVVKCLDSSSEPLELDSNIQILPSSNLAFAEHNSGQALKLRSHLVSEDVDSTSMPTMGSFNSNSTGNTSLLKASVPSSSSLGFPESGGQSPPTSFNQQLQGLASLQDSAEAYVFPSPYCSFPPCTPTLLSAAVTPNVMSSFADCLPLPPLSSLLSSNRSLNPFSTLKSPHNLVDVTPFDLSSFLSDPMVQVPLSISLATVTSSQQIPTFTPLMCDPIVHIPAIGFCSAGQGIVVGAGHAIQTTIPLQPHIAGPSISDSETMVEKGARETLQLLLNSAQTNPWSSDVLPAVLTSGIDGHDMLDAPNHDKCHEAPGFDVLANCIGAMEFVSFPSKDACDIKKMHGGDPDSSNHSEGCGGLNCSNVDDSKNDAFS